jgi:hypothetical protein
MERKLAVISSNVPAVEVKWSSRNISFSYLTYNNPDIYNFTNFSSGSGVGNIVGNSCRLKNLTLRFTLTHYTAGPACQFVRIIMFRYKPTEASLSSTGAGALLLDDYATAYSVNSHRNMNMKQDVVLL